MLTVQDCIEILQLNVAVGQVLLVEGVLSGWFATAAD